jgi:U3 small nucleolar ribonucleoprotein protein LCP5
MPFSNPQRKARGAGAGDLVDAMVEKRIVLDKVKALEGRMRYQIEKLVRLAQDSHKTNDTVLEDPLAFRPNPQALMDDGSAEEGVEDENKAEEDDGIYRPPKLAPTPYTETSGRKEKKR